MPEPVYFSTAALAPAHQEIVHRAQPDRPRPRATAAPVAEVIVLTHNSRIELAESLHSICQAAATAGAPLLFIDLGSADGTQEYVSGHAPGARAVWLTEHDRVIDALAVAAACSSAEVLVVLDPTLEPVSSDVLARMVEHLREHPYAGVAAPALRARDGELLRSTQPAPLPKAHSRVEWVLDAAFAIRRAELDAVTRRAGRRGRLPEDLRVCLELRRRGLEIHYVPSIELLDAGGRATEARGAGRRAPTFGFWGLLGRHPRLALRLAAGRPLLRRSGRALLRGLERMVTALAVVALAPLMVAIAIAVRLDSGGPALFRQVRLGRRARPFRMYKFRTMRADADPSPHAHFVRDMILGKLRRETDEQPGTEIFKVHPDPRVTRVGRFLRRTSLDELPQLFNVLRGDMSLVGFRPPIPYEVDNYPAWYHRRFDGTPGITGLWQVSGRNERSYEEMVRLDIEYLNRRSWLFDALVLIRTVGAVLGGRGAV